MEFEYFESLAYHLMCGLFFKSKPQYTEASNKKLNIGFVFSEKMLKNFEACRSNYVELSLGGSNQKIFAQFDSDSSRLVKKTEKNGEQVQTTRHKLHYRLCSDINAHTHNKLVFLTAYRFDRLQ